MLELKKRLAKNPHHIENILERYDFHNISIRGKEIRCGVDEETNSNSVQIKLNDNLTTNDWGRDIHGDLISLIMKTRSVDIKHVLQTIKHELGITHFEFSKKVSIFGGFYDNIRVRNKNNLRLQKYSEDVLSDYENKFNTLFLKDGINLKTQRKFRVGLCHRTSRITVPWFDYQAELVGIEGRYTGDYKQDEVAKWFPLIAFPKSQVLYGYHVNYDHLQGADNIYVGESSKFTMQLDSMGIHTSVALGGNSIHSEQIKQLSWLNPKRIILCFDEGLDEEIIQRQVEKTKNLLKFFDIKVGVVMDRYNEVLPKGSKNSPSDQGIECFKNLVSNYVEWM